MDFDIEELNKDPELKLAMDLIYNKDRVKEGIIILEDLENGEKRKFVVTILATIYYEAKKVKQDNKKVCFLIGI